MEYEHPNHLLIRDYPGAEVARILKRLAMELEGVTLDSGDYANLRDGNGSTVGKYEVSDQKRDTEDLVYVLGNLLRESRKPGKKPNGYWMAYHLAQSALSKWKNAD